MTQRVSVIGAGTMGHGIAQVCATAKKDVVLIDRDAAVLDKALKAIDKSLSKLVSKEKLSEANRADALSRITTATEIKSGVSKADLVIEAVPENLALKLAIFKEVDEMAPTSAWFGTNTSSLSVTEIAASTSRKERVVGLHFFNPVPLMKLLEVVSGFDTSDETRKLAQEFATDIQKEAVLVKDWPGFATSRLGIILGCEAIRMVEQGVAEPQAIDRAMELGYRHPMGPLRLIDLVGLDVRLAIMEHLHRELGEQFRPPALLRQMVRAGKLGKKSGQGFYDYDQS